MNLDIVLLADRGVALRLRESRSVARNVARNLATNAMLHCNSLFHGFTFLYAQGTDLRTGTVAISCFRPTHSARNVARNVAMNIARNVVRSVAMNVACNFVRNVIRRVTRVS